MKGNLGLYQAGDSILHRLPAGVKLLILIGVGAVSVLIQGSWIAVLILLVVITGLYTLAGMSARTLWLQVKPMLFLLVFTAVFHVWASNWQRAVAITGMLLALVALAALVTLTTPTSELVDSVVRWSGPLQRFGVDPERVGLMLTLGIRCVPLVAALAGEVREAQVARSNTTSFQAFAVPLIVRALREADCLGEALVARGVDD